MVEPLVSIIIVNWNGIKYLDDCLGSFSKISYKNVEVFFVDNASTDGSVEYVKKNYPHFKLIVNKKNLGFAEGHDEAFKKTKGDAILLLSMDTIVTKNFLSELVKSLYAKKDIGAVQPKLLIYPIKTIDSVGALFLLNGDLYHFGREKDPKLPKYNKPMEVYSAKGACILLRKNVLKKTGLFDKDYFAYFEETDLCHRVWLSGFRIVYNPNATVYHKGGGASSKMVKSYILFHSYKNRINTYLKNLSVKYLWIVLPQTLAIYQLSFLFYILQGRFDYALAVERGIVWNLTHIGEIMKKRKYVQENIRKISDDAFLPRLTRSVGWKYYYYQFFGSLKNYTDK